MSNIQKNTQPKADDKTTIKDKNKEYLTTVYRVGKAYYDAGKYDKALTIFRFLCLVDLTNYKFFLALATTQIKLKLINKAISTLVYTETLTNTDPKASLLLAQLFIEQQKLNLALQAANKAMQISQTNAEKWEAEQQQAENLISKINN